MGNVERIDDLVVLGRAAPESISDGRHTVCLGGYSPEQGFVRLYPTQMQMQNLKRWNVVSVPVDPEAEGDNRDESFKIAGSKQDWDVLYKKVEVVDRLEKPDRIRLIHELAGDCTSRLNDERKSLGVVDPAEIHKVYPKPLEDEPVQVELDGFRKLSKRNYDHKLYFHYNCKDCALKTQHEQHCIEWGVYQYWEKFEDPEGVIDALHINDPDWKIYFFVGNLRHHRTSFIIISVLRFKKDDMLEAGVRPDEQAGIADF